MLKVPELLLGQVEPQHESLEKFWWVLEWIRLPHRTLVDGVWKEKMIRYRGKGWRTIRDGDLVHGSVRDRANKHLVKNTNWAAEESKVQWVD